MEPNFFDKVAQGITSMAAVIVLMFGIITAMTFFSHTLFIDVFPSSMSDWEKFLATWFMAFGWEYTVLITTVNTRHVHKRLPLVMAIFSGVIVLFFIRAFDSSLTLLELVQRWFVGLLVAMINYIYAELFYKKWMERQSALAIPSLLDELQAKLNELQSAFDESQRKLKDSESSVIESRSRLNEITRELHELRAFKEKIDAELKCPYCKVMQSSHDSLRAHKGHCPKNSKAKVNNNNGQFGALP
jgi:hypothetical protein